MRPPKHPRTKCTNLEREHILAWQNISVSVHKGFSVSNLRLCVVISSVALCDDVMLFGRGLEYICWLICEDSLSRVQETQIDLTGMNIHTLLFCGYLPRTHVLRALSKTFHTLEKHPNLSGGCGAVLAEGCWRAPQEACTSSSVAVATVAINLAKRDGYLIGCVNMCGSAALP